MNMAPDKKQHLIAGSAIAALPVAALWLALG